jgi:hypothetical protein
MAGGRAGPVNAYGNPTNGRNGRNVRQYPYPPPQYPYPPPPSQ